MSLEFTGIDGCRISCGNSPLGIGTSDFAVAYWFLTTKADWGYAVSEGGWPEVAGKGFGCGHNAGAVYGYIHDGTRLIFGQGGAGWNDGKWHRRIDNFDRSGLWTCYIDGTTVTTHNIAARSGSINSANPLQIGDFQTAEGEFDGLMEDIRFFKRLLVEPERNLLDAGYRGPLGGEVAWFSGSESRGKFEGTLVQGTNILPDLSNNSISGDPFGNVVLAASKAARYGTAV